MSSFKFFKFNNKIFFFSIVIIIFLFSIFQRYHQFSVWKKYKYYFFVKNTPIMTTLDAYYWIRYARDYNKGIYYKTKDKLSAYPSERERPHPIPLLSFLVAKFSKIFKISEYYTGIYLIPILASLFILPFCYYFYLTGFPAAGILGSLFGTFSIAYMVRTSIGRVDIDCLCLFFPILSSLFLFLIQKTTNIKKIFILVILSSLSLVLFNYWYQDRGLIFIYFIFLIIYLFVNKINFKNIFFLLILFILIVQPIIILTGFKKVFLFLSNYGGFENFFHLTGKNGNNIFTPNILQTITESQHLPFKETLRLFFQSYQLGIIGLIFISIFFFFNIKKFLPILPIFLLGLFVFKGSNRLGMFLAPFIGAGLGICIDYSLKYFKKSNFIKNKELFFSCLISIIVFLLLSKQTAKSFVPEPSIPPDIYKTFYKIKNLPTNSAIYTWWDFGYAIMDIAEKATFHDGGTHGGWRTYLIARSFVNSSQAILYNTISFFDNNKLNYIKKISKQNKNIQDILAYIDNFKLKPKNSNIYVYFTNDLLEKFASINYIGNWNFDLKKGFFNGYYKLYCNKLDNENIYCRDYTINIKKGLLNYKYNFSKIVIINNGRIIFEKNYSNNSDYVIEVILQNNKIIYTFLLKKEIFKSNFNQMFILNHYDKNLFVEIFNDFPIMKTFKIKVRK